jgi:hypothetical protein
VSIVNWVKQAPNSCRLDDEEVPFIDTSLRSNTDVSEAVRLKANRNRCFQGVTPVGKGFFVSEDTALTWINDDQSNKDVIKMFSSGKNLAQKPCGNPDRIIIDFNSLSIEEAEAYKLPFEHLRVTVKAERSCNRRRVYREIWWQYAEKRPAMRQMIAGLSSFLAVPEVSKWAIFIVCQSNWLCGNKNKVVASDDFYILGLLTSSVHRQWMHAQKGTLKGDIAYTHDTCFETFPFPQLVTAEQAEAIRQKMIELNDYRNAWMVEQQKGITEMYNRYFDEPASKLRKLHDALDALVLKAYGWSAKDDVLANLLDLNLELAELEAEGQAVVGPWDPNTKHSPQP